MICSDHSERLYEPIGGEPFCLGHVVDHIVDRLGLSEDVAEELRDWAFDGADRDDDHDALERYSRAVRLYNEPAVALTEFRRVCPETVKGEAVRKAQDLLLFLGCSEKLASDRRDRDGFIMAAGRARDLIALLEAA
jgi:hypothetical protein